MVRLIVRLLLNAAVVFGIAQILEGMSVSSFKGAIITVLAFGLMNAFVRPILLLLTLPINILTLGLFTLVVNGLVLLLTSRILQSLEVQGLFTAIIASLLISAGSGIVDFLTRPKD